VQVIAVVFALACLAGAYAAGGRTDWHALRVRASPTAWLVDEIARGRANFVVADEIDRRVQSGAIDGAARERAVGALSRITGTARPSVRAGDLLPVETLVAPVPQLPFGNGRTERNESAPFLVYQRLERFRFDDGPWIEVDWFWNRDALVTINRDTLHLPVPADLAPGERMVDLVYAVRLVGREQIPKITDRSGQTHALDYRTEHPSTVAWQQVIRVATTVLPAGTDDVALVVDPSLRPAVRGSFQFREIDSRGFVRPNEPPKRRGITLYRNEGAMYTRVSTSRSRRCRWRRRLTSSCASRRRASRSAALRSRSRPGVGRGMVPASAMCRSRSPIGPSRARR
jgi:hypothetical protein